MSNEEAIPYFDGLKRRFAEGLEKEQNYWGSQHIRYTLDAIECALSALHKVGATDRAKGG